MEKINIKLEPISPEGDHEVIGKYWYERYAEIFCKHGDLGSIDRKMAELEKARVDLIQINKDTSSELMNEIQLKQRSEIRCHKLEESIRFLLGRIQDEDSTSTRGILSDWDSYRGSGGQDGWISRRGQ